MLLWLILFLKKLKKKSFMGFGVILIICKFCFIYTDLRTLPYKSMNPGFLLCLSHCLCLQNLITDFIVTPLVKERTTILWDTHVEAKVIVTLYFSLPHFLLGAVSPPHHPQWWLEQDACLWPWLLALSPNWAPCFFSGYIGTLTHCWWKRKMVEFFGKQSDQSSKG